MKNSNHASKALAVVLSGALAFAPAANAALDESNMAYTSAAEGFYGSLRVQYANNESGGEENDSKVEGESSRLGVRGDVDLGGGLEAFYGFEWNLGDPANGADNLNTRQHHVGLKGDWGSIWLGAFDSVIVRFGGFATTDITDQYGGNFEPRYRTKNAVAYVSPDLNGFQFGIEVQANDGEKKTTTQRDPIDVDGLNDPATRGTLSVQLPTRVDAVETVEADDGNDFDVIGLGASYSIQGLTFSGAYNQEQDSINVGGKTADSGQYALGIGYSQDNWVVAAMYGSKEIAVPSCSAVTDDTPPVHAADRCSNGNKEGDAPFLSLAAGVSIDKLDFHALWEQQTSEDALAFDADPTNDPTNDIADNLVGRSDSDTTITAVTARYHLGSKARLRAAWKNTEKDILDGTRIKSQDDTQYALGLRVDF